MCKEHPVRPASRPPQQLWKTQIEDILAWYEENLCGVELYDPRGKRIKFSPERFPHFIKLLDPVTRKDVSRPQKEVEAIRLGKKGNADYGGYDGERARTLPWIPSIVQEPSQILEVAEPSFWGKPGDTLIVKEFVKWGYRRKILVCRTINENLLVPITSHPSDKKSLGKAYKVVWP
jgi:hypothetical protein